MMGMGKGATALWRRVAGASIGGVLALGLALHLGLGGAAAETVEKPSIKLAVGGKPLLYYLPLTLTERLGYFKDAGLSVEISDFAGGSQSLKALIGGSADVTVGAFDHTVQMQAKGQVIEAVVLLGRYSGIALGIAKDKAAAYKGPGDLKGMKIGVTAPGSSTAFFASYLMVKAGLKPQDATFIGVGAGQSAVAAMQHGALDAIANLDPVVSQLESTGDIVVVADGRTTAGAMQIYGGPYPAAVLYTTPDFIARNPATVQALVTAFVRGLRWIQNATPEAIADQMPPEYYLGNKALYVAALAKSIQMYSPDGRLGQPAAEAAYKVLAAFDPDVQKAKIDLARTWDNRFVEKALATVK